jgi:hypothetical protein
VLLAVGCGSGAARQVSQPSLATVKKAFVARLNQEALTYRWVACVRNGRRYKGLPIVRCNVNFGMDPHVEAYCTVFEDGKLVTNHENKAIPCGHDNAGFTVPTAEGS